ncbi:DUF581 domain-containing protein [Cephalotus follicularis]|uniref:DUF581 domain-containing protein n=1 Tax=Cephalotus follicularis TaxID=3775 RepID=A0A1Q3AVJ7_CEPFO|nr:DUF581 domain-containing protein [Cephalotus follicularis]
MEKKRPTINLSLFTTLSDSFSSPTKSPRNFENVVVGLGIVAAMTDKFKPASPRSTPIPIVTCAKATAKFRDSLNFERENDTGNVDDQLDDDDEEEDESYTCVISHVGNNLIKKRVYYDDKVEDCCGVFDASPIMMVNTASEVESEFCNGGFLSSCDLCNKLLHGLDIFMYRGEKAYCSWECRDQQIRKDDYKEKYMTGALKPLNYSVSPFPGSLVFVAGVAAA